MSGFWLKDLSVRYGTHPALRGINVQAKAGQIIALVGPNGAGKSTLLKAVAGLVPSSGSHNLPQTRRDRAQNLAYLAQSPIAPELATVQTIVALGRTPHASALGRLDALDHIAIDEALQLCEIYDLKTRRYGSLSGGERRRVHLARSLATQAKILLTDEPTSALDPYYQLSIMNILQAYAHRPNQDQIVIAALHDLTLARQYCDQIWLMQDGALIEAGPPDQVLRPDNIARVFRIKDTKDGRAVLS